MNFNLQPFINVLNENIMNFTIVSNITDNRSKKEINLFRTTVQEKNLHNLSFPKT